VKNFWLLGCPVTGSTFQAFYTSLDLLFACGSFLEMVRGIEKSSVAVMVLKVTGIYL
jgi:hypothetical protein